MFYRLYLDLSNVLQSALPCTVRAPYTSHTHTTPITQISTTALLPDCFAILQTTSPTSLHPLLKSSPSPIAQIRTLLTSNNSNDQYIFLSCLECVHPSLWDGSSTEIQAVLEEREVERVMMFLGSADAGIRSKVRLLPCLLLHLFSCGDRVDAPDTLHHRPLHHHKLLHSKTPRFRSFSRYVHLGRRNDFYTRDSRSDGWRRRGAVRSVC